MSEYPFHQLIRLCRQDKSHNVDVRMLAQGYCVAIISLSLL